MKKDFAPYGLMGLPARNVRVIRIRPLLAEIQNSMLGFVQHQRLVTGKPPAARDLLLIGVLSAGQAILDQLDPREDFEVEF